ncbi:hypothetical protein ACFQZV_00020 [Microbacterium koreense]|uniref:Uncharacterized protein n=1 Tax=Microbacterium koreense TaxID=323761 RepID=A0ABW2ZMG8_9MICO
MTTEEAQLLATARFRNYDLGSRTFRASITDRGVEVDLVGWVDYPARLGYATLTTAGSTRALLWTGVTAGTARLSVANGDLPPLPVPGAGAEWTTHPIDPTISRLDAFLAALGALGIDRPDNPLILQQSGALWLREDDVEGIPVTVFAAPPDELVRDPAAPPLAPDASPLHLWVDGSGLILRVDMRLGGEWESVIFEDAPGERLTLPDDLVEQGG